LERYAPPPEIPMIQMTVAPVMAVAVTNPLRPVTAEDLVANDLELSDLSLDFSDVELPKSQATEAEIEELCNRVYERVMQPPGTSVEIQ
jgi:hypothetical protein